MGPGLGIGLSPPTGSGLDMGPGLGIGLSLGMG
jgi:hypothetical protein